MVENALLTLERKVVEIADKLRQQHTEEAESVARVFAFLIARTYTAAVLYARAAASWSSAQSASSDAWTFVRWCDMNLHPPYGFGSAVCTKSFGCVSCCIVTCIAHYVTCCYQVIANC